MNQQCGQIGHQHVRGRSRSVRSRYQRVRTGQRFAHETSQCDRKESRNGPVRHQCGRNRSRHARKESQPVRIQYQNASRDFPPVRSRSQRVRTRHYLHPCNRSSGTTDFVCEGGCFGLSSVISHFGTVPSRACGQNSRWGSRS